MCHHCDNYIFTYKEIFKYFDILPCVIIVTNHKELFRLNNNTNKKFKEYYDIMPHVIITFVVKYHMWVIGGHMMLRGMNKDVYFHVAKWVKTHYK